MISIALRTYTWHYYRVHVNVQSLQFSLLAGRLFFKEIKYQGRNETILIQDGYITWRYWLRHVQEFSFQSSGSSETDSDTRSVSNIEEDTAASSHQSGGGETSRSKELPCRIAVRIRGLQWFIYNRSPSYDAILQAFTDGADKNHEGGSTSANSDEKSAETESKLDADLGMSNRSTYSPADTLSQDTHLPRASTNKTTDDSIAVSTASNNAAIPSILNILPIGFDCGKGAIVLGNQFARSALVASFDGGIGRVEASSSTRPDNYKQVIDFRLLHPVVKFKHNKDFRTSFIAEGERLAKSGGQQAQRTRTANLTELDGIINRLKFFLETIVLYILPNRGRVSHPLETSGAEMDDFGNKAGADVGVYGRDGWLGLTRYLHDENDDDDDLMEQDRWKSIEYAQFSTVVDSPEIAVNVHWDDPGFVPHPSDERKSQALKDRDDINGSAPPDWGINLRVKGGTITYGPWADRQRAELQAIFVPTLHQDFRVATKLNPGQRRVNTELKILVEIEQQTTLRIPTREESKDWKWKHRALTPKKANRKRKRGMFQIRAGQGQADDDGPDHRPFGWLDVSVLPDSTVSFTMDLVAKSTGFGNRLNLDLRGVEVSSSVNHALFLRSQSQLVSCDLGNPLEWNTLHQWHIDIQDQDTELFLLRDHIFLLTDMINDWGTGPPSDFFTFIPFEYLLKFDFKNVKLFVNANDNNIINNPADINDNTFVVIGIGELEANLTVPLLTLQPTRNRMTFDIDAKDGLFELMVPAWNTQSTFLSNKDMASLKHLSINGSYDYYTTVSPSLTDTLFMELEGESPSIALFGFLIRDFMKIKENYFGDDIHFRTVEEYQTLKQKLQTQSLEPKAFEPRHRVVNDLDVILVIRALKSCIQLPAQLYSIAESVDLEVHLIEADLRVTNYYMDLAIRSSPIALSRSSQSESLKEAECSVQIFVDGLDVTGHRLFGLAPTEPTYVCNWDFEVGRVSGECTTGFVRSMSQVIKCFGLTFDDLENAVPSLLSPAIYDMTFLRLYVQPISVALRVDRTAFLIACAAISMNFNDYAGSRFSDRLWLSMPNITMSLVDTEFSAQKSIDRTFGATHAAFRTAVELRKVSRAQNFESQRQLQQYHVALHDLRTQRTPWLVHDREQHHREIPSSTKAKIHPPAMPFPFMPSPLHSQRFNDASFSHNSSTEMLKRIPFKNLSGKGSFLSNAHYKSENSSQITAERLKRGNVDSEAAVSTNDGSPSSQEHGPRPKVSTSLPGSTSSATSEPSLDPRPHRLPAAFSFTSPYKRPSFPLLALSPDLRQLPELPNGLETDALSDEGPTAADFNNSSLIDSTQDSLLINFNRGVQIFCNPKALFLVIKLQENFQSRDPETVLDRLQVDALAEVFQRQEKKDGPKVVFNSRLYCPYVGMKFINVVETRTGLGQRQESYHLNIRTLTATIATSDSEKRLVESATTKRLSMHVAFSNLECSAGESLEGHKAEHAIIGLVINQLILWLSRSDAISAGVQFANIKAIGASRKVDYISSLVRQTLLLSEALAERLTKIVQESTQRLQLLVFLLTQASDVPADPPFLSATSYLLRGDTSHLRSSDSWKMISRLRFVLRELPIEARNDLLHRCIFRTSSCPEDAHARVLSTFDKWRTWDLAQMKPSILMGKIFNVNNPSHSVKDEDPIPVKVSIKFDSMRLLVDPGIHQNEVVISNSIIGLNLFQRQKVLRSLPEDAVAPWVSTIEVFCVEVALRLNWSLCELVENVLQTVRRTAPAVPVLVPSAGNKVQPQVKCHWHVIFSTQSGILSADTLSLKVVSICQGLQISTLLATGQSDLDSYVSSIVIHAEAATSEVRSRSKQLTLYKLRRPTIIGSKSKLSTTNDIPISLWRFVGSGNEVIFQVLADILDITEAAETFVKNEVTFIASWIATLQADQTNLKAPKQSMPQDLGLPTVHLTLFLDAYFVSLAVLPALVYKIHGNGGRTSIRLGLRETTRGDIDIDIMDHTHVFSAGIDESSEELAALHIPPIDGRLSFDLNPENKKANLRALAEPIIFEASAIHSLITAINRPEVVNLGRNVDHQIKKIQKRVNDISRPQNWSPTKKSVSSEPLIYDAYVILAGFAVHASTPDTNFQEHSAEFDFNMGRIQMKAANSNSKASDLSIPKFEVILDDMRLRLMRTNDEESIPCGELIVGLALKRFPGLIEPETYLPTYQVHLANPTVSICADTASVVVAIAGHLQDTLKTIDVSEEVKFLGKLGYAKLLNDSPPDIAVESSQPDEDAISAALRHGMYAVEVTNIRLMWRVEESIPTSAGREREDLVLSVTKIDFSTRKSRSAQLAIQEFQLQMAPPSHMLSGRSGNSALLPEIIFNVAYLSTSEDRRLAFQAKGKALDLRLTSQFLLPSSDLRRSIATGVQQVRTATARWGTSTKSKEGPKNSLFGNKKLASLLINADFAGAVVHLQGRNVTDSQNTAMRTLRGDRLPQRGRYNQFTPEDASGNTVLRAPGIAIKVEYKNAGPRDHSLNAETRVDASTNTLYPTVVPLILEISSSVREIVGESTDGQGEARSIAQPETTQNRFLDDERLRSGDPLAIFGDCSLNFGLRICTQEFNLSCQPIARVAATARFEDIYITSNTVRSGRYGKFFSFSAAFTGLQTSIQHVYSRESTGGIRVDSVILSLMNSRHVSGANGISAILNLSPMKIHINAKQSQDFLLFREIWLPAEIRNAPSRPKPAATTETQVVGMQKYQQVAASGAFIWSATVSIAALDVQLDLGQSLGKLVFTISKFWTSSKKSSDWEQNLCVGFDKVGVNSTGRMSGLIELHNFRVRTSIHWPNLEEALNQTPLIQASMGFDHLEVKAGFDYQAFLIAHISTFDFLMYNVRDPSEAVRDRLVGSLDGDRVQIFCTTSSASQALSLYQAFQRLIQEKQSAYEASLKDIEKFMRRKSSINPYALRDLERTQTEADRSSIFSSLKLQTDVVVTLKAINIGAFPSTFFDNQVFKMEALGASARFAVFLEEKRIHSVLELVLGEFRIALASVSRPSMPKALGEVSISDVISAATGSRGGTILKVPRLIANMQTWQSSDSNEIEFIFTSSCQGKVDVGWNYSRVSYIRGMWNTHSRTLAQRLGKPLPLSAVQITGLEDSGGTQKGDRKEQEKITAVVNVPQSKYQYRALQPPIIDTPQLRDMGEATPPLEWIGLHRERLPNLTHQIVIVSLLRVAKDIDDAYSQILGSSS